MVRFPVIEAIDQEGSSSAGSLSGVSASGTPSSGQVLTATSPTTATWQTPSSGGAIGYVTVKDPAFGAKGDAATAFMSVTSGQSVVTGSGFTNGATSFVVGDVGKVICIVSNTGSYRGKIVSVASGNATMDTVASQTFTNLSGAYGTDDTAAINSAIAASSLAGATELVVPSATYLIDGLLNFSTSGLVMRGLGRHSGSPSPDEGGAVLLYTNAGQLLSAPTGVSAVAGTGGSLAAGTYFYKITALSPLGETTGSTEVSATVGASGKVSLSWSLVTGASAYKVYRATTSGGESTSPAQLVFGSTAFASYTDVGNAVGAGAVPAANTAAIGMGFGYSTNDTVISGITFRYKNNNFTGNLLDFRNAGQGDVTNLRLIDNHFEGVARTDGPALSAPSGLAVAAVGSGGTFAAGTYFWRITFVSGNGETTGSNEVSTAIVLNGSANLTWPTVPFGATQVKVYRSTTTGGQTTSPALVATLAVTNNSYTDTGTATSAGAVPAANTATVTHYPANSFLTVSGLIDSVFHGCRFSGSNDHIVLGDHNAAQQYVVGLTISGQGTYNGHNDAAILIDSGDLEAVEITGQSFEPRVDNCAGGIKGTSNCHVYALSIVDNWFGDIGAPGGCHIWNVYSAINGARVQGNRLATPGGSLPLNGGFFGGAHFNIGGLMWQIAGNGIEGGYLFDLSALTGGAGSQPQAPAALFTGNALNLDHGPFANGSESSFGSWRAWANQSSASTPVVLETIAAIRMPNTQQAGTTYTFTLGDIGSCVEFTNGAGAITATVPPNSSVAFPVGAIIEVFQDGQQVAIAAGAGVTLRSDGGLVHTKAQYATIRLRQRAVNEWVLSGDLI